MTDSAAPKRGLFFYGWVIVAACLLVALVVDGTRYSFGVFFSPLEAEFGWPRAATSGIFAAYMVLGSLFAIISGWVVDRYGPKPVVVIMGVVTGTGLLLTSRVDQAWHLYITYSLLLAAGTGGTYVVLMSTGSKWFVRRRATALGIIGSGSGLGAMAIALIAAQLISAYDWRAAFLGLAIILWAVVIPLAFLLKKGPREIGALPDGDRRPPAGDEEAEAHHAPVHFSLLESLKTRSFWFFLMVWFSYSFSLHMVVTHVVPHAEDLGIVPVQAAAVVSVVGAISIPSRVALGIAADRVGRKWVGIACALTHTVAMVSLIFCKDVWSFYLFAVIYGIGYGGIDPPIVAMIGDTFGLRQVGVIMGSMTVGWGLGAALGPYTAGAIFDARGSYTFAFMTAALIMVMAALLISRLDQPRLPPTVIPESAQLWPRPDVRCQ